MQSLIRGGREGDSDGRMWIRVDDCALMHPTVKGCYSVR